MVENKATDLDTVKREAMIEMLEAMLVAFGIRAEKFKVSVADTPRVVLSPRENKRNKRHVYECKIRIDEIQELCKLLTGTIETCKEQNDGN